MLAAIEGAHSGVILLPDADIEELVVNFSARDQQLAQIQLGEHRVLCGSALDPAAYAALLGREQADMVFIDPPYNVPIAGNVSGLGAIRHREFAMASGEMRVAEFMRFLIKACSLLAGPQISAASVGRLRGASRNRLRIRQPSTTRRIPAR